LIVIDFEATATRKCDECFEAAPYEVRGHNRQDATGRPIRQPTAAWGSLSLNTVAVAPSQ